MVPEPNNKVQYIEVCYTGITTNARSACNKWNSNSYNDAQHGLEKIVVHNNHELGKELLSSTPCQKKCCCVGKDETRDHNIISSIASS